MKKTTILIIIAAIYSLLISGCMAKNIPTVPPDIHISIGEKSVNSSGSIIKWDGTAYKNSDPLKSFIQDSKAPEIPYFEIGKSIEISFKTNPPDKLVITNTLLTEGGEQLYTDKEILNIATDYKNGNCKFEIPMHPASALSSLVEEGKRDIQGYRILASWGENACEYVFAIRTESAGSVKSTTKILTIEDVKELSKKREELTWSDFLAYNGKEVGSGLYIMWYPIDDKYSVLVGGAGMMEKPFYIQLVSKDSNGIEQSIDIRRDDIDNFLQKAQ